MTVVSVIHTLPSQNWVSGNSLSICISPLSTAGPNCRVAWYLLAFCRGQVPRASQSLRLHWSLHLERADFTGKLRDMSRFLPESSPFSPPSELGMEPADTGDPTDDDVLSSRDQEQDPPASSGQRSVDRHTRTRSQRQAGSGRSAGRYVLRIRGESLRFSSPALLSTP